MAERVEMGGGRGHVKDRKKEVTGRSGGDGCEEKRQQEREDGSKPGGR